MSNLPESSPSSESNELMRVPTGSELVRQVESGLGLVKEVLREGDAEYWLEKGIEAYGLANYFDAIHYFTCAIKINTDYKEPYYWRAYANEKAANFHEAVSDLDQVVRIDPHYSSAYSDRGDLKNILGNIEAAIEDWDQALMVSLKDKTTEAELPRSIF